MRAKAYEEGSAIDRTCCVTGHRDIAEEHVETVRAGLRQAVVCAVAEGYTRFLSGFARGADLYFAEIVAELKGEDPALRLEALLPYRSRQRSQDPLFRRLIAACDRVEVQSESYTPTCFFERDRALVEASSLVIAVYDGRPAGGTRYTLRYANRMGREVRQVRPASDHAEQLTMLF
ncbi:MAG: DUF1273 domain-containing protein [Clostridia bacterium]|nr:DUF1273 domain-containing protein [Clostridia bacterium]